MLNRLVCVSIACALFLSCTSIFSYCMPYCVTKKSIVAESKSGVCNFCYAEIQIVNNSEKAIREFEICFSIFDSSENPIGTFTNAVRAKCAKKISPRAEEKIFVCLDDFLECASGDCKLDFVYIAKIVYEDNSVWTDEAGIYVS